MNKWIAASTVAAALALAGPSSAAPPTNTFSVQCHDVPIFARWDPPVTGVPQPKTLFGNLSGGSCSGSVNGHRFEDKPFRGRAAIPGVHSCEAGEGQGRSVARIDGKNLYATVSYRRAGRDGVIVFQGDSGGQAILKIHGQVGVIPADSPLASIPVFAPLVDSTDFASFAQACATPQGVSKLGVWGDFFISTPTISSPASEGPPHSSRPAPAHRRTVRGHRRCSRRCAG